MVIGVTGMSAAIGVPPFLAQRDKSKHAAAKSGVHNNQPGMTIYYVDHTGDYHAAKAPDSGALVDVGGHPYVGDWPLALWTQPEMAEGLTGGNFTYAQLVRGGTFSLVGRLDQEQLRSAETEVVR